jgi:hypothetical protein
VLTAPAIGKETRSYQVLLFSGYDVSSNNEKRCVDLLSLGAWWVNSIKKPEI